MDPCSFYGLPQTEIHHSSHLPDTLSLHIQTSSVFKSKKINTSELKSMLDFSQINAFHIDESYTIFSCSLPDFVGATHLIGAHQP